MKVKLDENLPAELAGDLRDAGHDAETVVQEGLAGHPDGDILARTTTERRVLLTMDKGIADVRVYPADRYAGIVLYRPASSGRAAAMELVRTTLKTVLSEDLQGRLLVVSERGVRTR